MNISLLWLRDNLRLSENAALTGAVAFSKEVIPVYIHSPREAFVWAPGAAARWWLHHSLKALDASLRKRGSRLIIRRGKSIDVLNELCDRCNITHVHAARLTDPLLVARDERIIKALGRREVTWERYESATLMPPDRLLKNTGTPYRVFTPFWKKFNAVFQQYPPLPPPQAMPPVDPAIESLSVEDLELLPPDTLEQDWAAHWRPGEKSAMKMLKAFTRDAMLDYPVERNRPDHDGTSKLSPYLHFGELSPRQVWWAATHAADGRAGLVRGREHFLRELGWREFAYYALQYFPQSSEDPLDARFNDFPWRAPGATLEAWQQGRTGIPIVDAGMRQLRRSGWMHNRVRMIVASFLSKNCLIDWREGARWFWDTLVDADLANNTLNWQWTAGCGVDAAPFFRIFNPLLQAAKFDPDGDYVRRWVPELAGLDNSVIHQPWTASPPILAAAGVVLGVTYPHPIVELRESRAAALEAFAAIRNRPARDNVWE